MVELRFFMKKISSFVICFGICICLFGNFWFGPSLERVLALTVFCVAGVLSVFYR
jgi:hypothetical protein